MRAEIRKCILPLDYNPYDEDCCGSYTGDHMIIHCNYQEKLKIHIQEKPSGVGPEYEITAETVDGQKCEGILHVSYDDDGELNFYMKPNVLK
mgnify:CR=1 FL=1